MFGLDAYTFETFWPSMILIGVMVGALAWGWVKVRALMEEDGDK